MPGYRFRTPRYRPHFQEGWNNWRSFQPISEPKCAVGLKSAKTFRIGSINKGCGHPKIRLERIARSICSLIEVGRIEERLFIAKEVRPYIESVF